LSSPSSAHGNKGVVRAIFEKGLPGQAVTTPVEVKYMGLMEMFYGVIIMER